MGSPRRRGDSVGSIAEDARWKPRAEGGSAIDPPGSAWSMESTEKAGRRSGGTAEEEEDDEADVECDEGMERDERP